MRGRILRTRPPGADYDITIIGARATPLRDFYHLLLRSSWALTFAFVTALFLAVNGLFALLYLWTGGVAHVRPGSLLDLFYFSVQTMGTIGYGAMYPESPLANALVVAESLVGLLLTALCTGLVFAKFSRPVARMVFSDRAVISPMDGVPTLALRIGNERGNTIVDAQLRVSLARTERTREGKTFYRMIDLKLARDRALSLSRSFTILHPIDEASPLFGATPELLAAQEAELTVLVIGMDDVSMQPMHASRAYIAPHIVFGARHADVLSEGEGGSLVLDLRRFHDLEPTEPTEAFPFPRRAGT